MPNNPNAADNLKPFEKGHDPRRNVGGRPTDAAALRKLAQRIGTRDAKDAEGNPVIIDGHVATVVEVLLVDMAQHDPDKFLDRAFGRVPQAVEMSGKDGAPLVVKGYIGISPDDWDALDEKKPS